MELTVTHVLRLSPEVEALLRVLFGQAPRVLAEPVPDPPPVPKPAASSQPHRSPPWLTPEREALLRVAYPSEVPMGDVLARLNALPGARVTSGQVYVEAPKLGLKRPFPSPGTTMPPVPLALPRALPVKTVPVWTDERLLALQLGWERGDSEPDILTVVNGLPGERIASAQVLRAKALDEAFVRPRTGPAPIVDGKVQATWAQIDAWAAPRGMRMQAAADLVGINAKRGQLGLPLFAVPEGRGT